MNSFRELIVWQKGMALVTSVYGFTRGFPKEEIYGLRDQIRRAAVSVPSNIAEGYGRQSTQDYIRFLQISRGSLYELETQLEIAANLGFLEPDTFVKLDDAAREIERMLSALIHKIRASKEQA
jgi:four helix bundle protein